MNQVPAVEILRQVWVQPYCTEATGGEWIRSPYDPEVRYGRKRQYYKLHLTEVSDPDHVHFITQIRTVEAIQQDLAEKDLTRSYSI